MLNVSKNNSADPWKALLIPERLQAKAPASELEEHKTQPQRKLNSEKCSKMTKVTQIY